MIKADPTVEKLDATKQKWEKTSAVTTPSKMTDKIRHLLCFKFRFMFKQKSHLVCKYVTDQNDRTIAKLLSRSQSKN